MTTPRVPTAERRHNHSLRSQAQAWFQALQLRIAEIEGAEAIVPLIKEWKRPEDVMRAYPALVPLFLDIVWRSRKTPGFADLFRTETGEVAEAPSELLALSQKSFDDIVIAHLMGTLRLTCEGRQNEWVAAERENRRGVLSKMPIVGAALRGVGLLSPVKTEALLADYPQKGLYDVLKPVLRRREQFALVEALAALPTRTASLLGPVVGALESSDVIRTVADLDRTTVKIVIEMAEAFVQAVHGTAEGAESESQDLTGPRAAALSGMLRAGMGFITIAAGNRQLAKDAIAKLAPVMRADVWTVFGDVDSLRRISECPAAVAEALQALTVEVNERVSIALSEITDSRIATFAVSVLRDGTAPEIFLSWIREETYLTAWKQLVQNLNRTAVVPAGEERLGPNLKASLKTVCSRGAQVFVELADPAKKVA